MLDFLFSLSIETKIALIPMSDMGGSVQNMKVQCENKGIGATQLYLSLGKWIF